MLFINGIHVIIYIGFSTVVLGFTLFTRMVNYVDKKDCVCHHLNSTMSIFENDKIVMDYHLGTTFWFFEVSILLVVAGYFSLYLIYSKKLSTAIKAMMNHTSQECNQRSTHQHDMDPDTGANTSLLSSHSINNSPEGSCQSTEDKIRSAFNPFQMSVSRSLKYVKIIKVWLFIAVVAQTILSALEMDRLRFESELELKIAGEKCECPYDNKNLYSMVMSKLVFLSIASFFGLYKLLQYTRNGLRHKVIFLEEIWEAVEQEETQAIVNNYNGILSPMLQNSNRFLLEVYARNIHVD